MLPPHQSNTPYRILFVDDDVKLRTMLGLMLTYEGYDVSHANNGEQALVLHRRNPFDLLITELAMDGKDGFQTIMELRRDTMPVKFIATTRLGWMPADQCLRMAEHLGAHCVLTKPFDPQELLSAVYSALGQN